MAQVPGDRRDRPAPAMQRVRVHIVLPCEHERWRSLRAARWSETGSLEGTSAVSAEPRGWGISVSRSGEIHLSAVSAGR